MEITGKSFKELPEFIGDAKELAGVIAEGEDD